MKRKHSEIYKEHYSNVVKPLDYVMSASINQMIYNVDVLKMWNKYKKAIMFYRRWLLVRFNDTYTRNAFTRLQRSKLLGYPRRKVYLDDAAKIALVYMYCAFCLTKGELSEIERKELAQTKYYEAVKTTYAKYPSVKA